MERQQVDALYRRMLLELWHADDGALDTVADAIAADDLVIHQNGAQQHGAGALAELVRQGRAPFADVSVGLTTGPAIDGDLIAARWTFSGAYAGGIPGASAPVGTTVTFSGIDLVRVADGRVAEYWVCSDGADLMRQLGV